MDLITRFDRGPREEIRVVLVRCGGEMCLELRVYDKAGPVGQEPNARIEGISIPLSRFGELAGAIRAAEALLRRRKLLPEGTSQVTQMVGGVPTLVSGGQARAAGLTAGAGQPLLARSEPRLRLNCLMEYEVQSRLRPEHVGLRRGGRVLEISRTGAQVLLPERVPVLTALLVTLHLPAGVITVGCEVAWAQHLGAPEAPREGCRHGLRFTDVGPDEYMVLDRTLAEASRQTSA